MNPYGSIHTIYRAEVRIPIPVWERFGHTEGYDQFSLYAARYVEASGQDAYAEVIEWGEAPERAQVERFGKLWHDQITQWLHQIAMEARP